jgi:hypothetical protein
MSNTMQVYTIRPLVWFKTESYGGDPDWKAWVASTSPLSRQPYEIIRSPKSGKYVVGDIGVFDILEDAQEAAQKNFETTVLKLLTPAHENHEKSVVIKA